MQFRILAIATAVGAALAVGCGSSGPTYVAADGTVHFKGRPLPNAAVTFAPEGGGVPAVGTTDSEGRFILMTQGQQGALVGAHAVSVYAVTESRPISSAELQTMTTAQVAQIRKPAIPEKYAHPRTSGLTANVGNDASENHFQFVLEN